jgi:GDP-4-dehydro-6-deoxy-D-mannose reductase
MRVVITGSGGFVGTWLTGALSAAGHDPIDLGVDVTDRSAVIHVLDQARPDAVAHLAAVSFAPDAASDPAQAFKVAVGGTINVLEAVRLMGSRTIVLVTSSSEVYGRPEADELPFRETSPLRPLTPYALSKGAQESVALAYASRYALRVVVTRSFNHTGPGQRPEFVVPAIRTRVADVAAGRAHTIPVGNLDVRRDFSDVRDVVQAYRALLEQSAAASLPPGGITVNVSSGRSVPIRWIVEEFCRLAGVEARIEVREEFVRAGEPPDIWGEYSALERLTGWRPRIPLTRTLADMWSLQPST